MRPTELAQWLRNRRVSKGLTVAEAAKKMRVSPWTLKKWECSMNLSNTTALLDAIERAYGVRITFRPTDGGAK